jgi:hypothetical protein
LTSAAYFTKERFPGGPIGIPSTNLDQFVTFQTAFDFRQNRGRQAFPADQHQRSERMRSRFQLAAPGGCQIMHGGSLRNGPH